MSDIQPYTEPATDLAPMTPVNAGVLDQMKSYAEAWGTAATIADQMAKTDFAGPFKGKPADLAVAILKGTSIGIQPADIGKAIYVVHGAPALYGKTALQIAKAHGYKMHKTEETPQAVTCVFTAPDGEEYTVRYTYERAEREGLVKGNPTQYKTRPEKMLTWKCIGEAADMFFPHIVGGMAIKEDVEQSPVKMQATRTDQRGMGAVRAALAEKKQDTTPASPSLDDLRKQVETAPDRDALGALMTSLQDKGLSDEDYEQLAHAANKRWDELATEAGE